MCSRFLCALRTSFSSTFRFLSVPRSENCWNGIQRRQKKKRKEAFGVENGKIFIWNILHTHIFVSRILDNIQTNFLKISQIFFSVPNFQTNLFISGNELDLPLCDRDFFVRGIRNAHPIRVLGHLQSNTFDFSIETLQNYYSRIGFMSLFQGEQPLEKWYIKNYTRSQIETFSRIIFR